MNLTILESGASSLIVVHIYFFLAHNLDKIYDEKKSTFIAYLFTAFLNFILQHNIFNKSILTLNIIQKYIFVVILELTINQVCVSYLLDKKHLIIHYIPDKFKPYYSTIIRSFIQIFIFICISYPLRLYWIFN